MSAPAVSIDKLITDAVAVPSVLSRIKRFQTPLIVLGALLLLTITRMFTPEATGLTEPLIFSTALLLAAPIAITGLGGIISERAGIVNIGLQGMMVMGTCFAGLFGWHFGPWMGLVGGVVGGALAGALHAMATITFGVNHTVSGVAINLLTPGICRYMASVLFAGKGDDGSLTNSPTMVALTKYTVPILSGGHIGSWQSPDVLGRIAEKKWFLISDVAGLFGGFTKEISAATLVVLIIFPIAAYLLWRTPWGLRLRSCGEKPAAAESLGINVIRTQWTAVLLSGALAGLGGACLAVDVGRYIQGQVDLRGFLALACVVFGNWKLGGVLAGSLVFEYPDAVRLVTFGKEPRSLVFVGALAFALLAIWSYSRKNLREGLVVTGLTAAALAWFTFSKNIDAKLTATFPYLITLLVLVFSSQRQRPPAAAGITFRKGSS
jgi:general nucleoside transport system permease protein